MLVTGVGCEKDFHATIGLSDRINSSGVIKAINVNLYCPFLKLLGDWPVCFLKAFEKVKISV